MPDPTSPLQDLPLDHGYAALGGSYHARVSPAPLPDARLLHFNPDAAALIGLDPAAADDPAFLAVMAGNAELPGGDYLASLYAGHQFGQWVPQLGDGRALLIGAVRNTRGETWELQLKGAGPTPFSRFADGRAVLRSSIREYLCGEAMHRLGIPTTRALCLVGSSEPVRRETVEHAAVVCRMAPSFLRFGHFEVFFYRNQHEQLRPLADYAIESFFPQFAGRPDRYRAWLTEVCERTARLMAQWQTAGFCHGVMNTDNMSILGLTLDYGPYGFMDGFDAGHICNHSDEGGRYAYDQQPRIGHWNVSRLVQATLPLLHENPDTAVEIGTAIIDGYGTAYGQEVVQRWRAKIGLREHHDGDEQLVNRLLTLMHQGRSDFTRSFRHLSRIRAGDEGPATGVREEIVAQEAFDAWVTDYRARLRAEQSDDAMRAAAMNAVNPKYVLRNHLAQACIERAEAGDFGELGRLMQLLARPFDEQPEFEAYAAEPPAEARHISVSCSS
ncbi:YdiU family protein [Solimonas sp. K1W22B-7]|nr:YdiU family protein [Solimonas sp. K1W22B-7]